MAAARINLQDQFGDLARVEVQLKRKIRFGITSLRDLGGDGESNQEDDHARGVVLIDLLPHDNGLRTLGDDTQ